MGSILVPCKAARPGTANRSVSRIMFTVALALSAPCFLATDLAADPNTPIVKTVPFLDNNPVAPHTSWSGNTVTLKGTMSSPQPADTFTYVWNPGDGTAGCTGTVTNPYVISCQHTYTGAINTLYNATLTVTDTTLSLTSASVSYYTTLASPPPNLSVEVNNAIDNGLWYIHQHMHRTSSGGLNFGDFTACDGNNVDACQIGYYAGPTGSYCNAFEVSGFLQSGASTDPYTEDVQRCMNSLFNYLSTTNISGITITNPAGTYTPDSNGNGLALSTNEGRDLYETGMMMDAIVANGSLPAQQNTLPNLLSTSALFGLSGTGPGGKYSYKDAITDMTDYYSYCESNGTFDGFSYQNGGWRYSCQDDSDNSVSQWAAIGIIPARRSFGVTVPPAVLKNNQSWLQTSFNQNAVDNGNFGYSDSATIWGPYADTPSGMVQLDMNGLGRGTTIPGGAAAFDSAESYIRDNFGNNPVEYGTGDPFDNAVYSIKGYPYGLYSFTKSMLLHDNSGDGLHNTPIQLLRSLDNAAMTPIDWYAAQAPPNGSDPTDGVARYLLSIQLGDGSWFGQGASSSQYYLETAWAVTMLNKTVFKQVPVACASASPNPVAAGGPVTLNGMCSTDANNPIVSYEWDVSGTGGTNFTIAPGSAACLVKSSCVEAKYNFNLPHGATLPYNYPVRLRITDSANQTADVVFNVVISSPPTPPTAVAGGPYNFCPNTVNNMYIYPAILNGSNSINPDQGKTDGTPGAPPSTIVSYQWDFSCSGAFNSANGAQVNVSGDFLSKENTSFNVCLKVTNNDNLAFPTAGLATGLSGVGSANVFVHTPTDEQCTHCVATLGANGKGGAPNSPGTVQIYWTDTNTATAFTIDHYNIYRSTSSTFIPFVEVAGANSVYGLPAVQVPAVKGSTVYFKDTNVTTGQTYYYRVAPATSNDTETCQSNLTLQVTVKPIR